MHLRLSEKSRRLLLSLLAAGILSSGGLIPPARACTIFVLTDGERTLFFNNEDWSNPISRIWFVPAPSGFYSCAYVGFDNNGAEGGMNSAGLAFDWVAGFDEKWKPYETMLPVGGRSSERMLESCASVREAIAFYEKYREPQFSRAKILVADRSGASAIIGARNGKLHIDRRTDSRGFGYGRKTLDTMLKADTAPQLQRGLEILRACEQTGQYATKYSSVFDLNAGEILLSHPGSSDPVRIHLEAGLKRGAHYYDIPKIHEQMSAPPKPALNNMRSFLREYVAVADTNSAITEKVFAITERCAQGKMRSADFSKNLWDNIKNEDLRAQLNPFGDLDRAVLVGHNASSNGHLYKLEFRNAAVVQEFAFDPEGGLASIRPVGVEWKHPLPE